MTREEHVLELWDNAVENGYGQWLLESEAIDVAADMIDCDCDIAAIFYLDFDGLVAIVRKIQKDNQNA